MSDETRVEPTPDGRIPGIVPIDGPPETARVPGTGIEVWEMVSIFENVGRDWETLKQALHWLTEEQLRAAMAYAEQHEDAIRARIEENQRWTPEKMWEMHPFTKPPWR